MTNWKHLNRLPVYILAAVILTSCGTSTSFSGSGSTPIVANVTPTPTPSPSGTTSSSPALSYSGILVTGPGGTSPTYSAACESTNVTCANPSYITTTNLLEVQVTPQAGGLLAAPTGVYSGFSATYNCASYQVEVLDDQGDVLGSQQTGMLAVSASAPCMDGSGNAITTTSQILNFSPTISQSSHGPLDVRISAVDYDFYCKLWYQEYDLYGYESPYYAYYTEWCPSKVVFKNHTIGVSMEVEINGTSF